MMSFNLRMNEGKVSVNSENLFLVLKHGLLSENFSLKFSDNNPSEILVENTASPLTHHDISWIIH
jgi:hypothetical protein